MKKIATIILPIAGVALAVLLTVGLSQTTNAAKSITSSQVKACNNTYNTAVKTADTAYTATVKSASSTYTNNIKAANTAYTAAIKSANQTYATAVKKANDTYKSATTAAKALTAAVAKKTAIADATKVRTDALKKASQVIANATAAAKKIKNNSIVAAQKIKTNATTVAANNKKIAKQQALDALKICKSTVNNPVNNTIPNNSAQPSNNQNSISCASPTDTRQMDIFDSHVHMSSTVDAPRMISEMDKAGVSVSNLYADASHALEAISQYPGRFITFVDTPEPPNPSAWLTQGQAFVASAETQLKTGKFYGIGETNLRLSDKKGNVLTPDVNVPADTPAWLQLVDLSARYHVPISFHFVPEDAVANAAFERMLSHNKDAILLWAHLGFNSMTLDSIALNDYLLRYPHLYFDTAGIQNMQRPIPLDGSNWARLADQSNNGKLKAEWKKFFETWNSRILFGTDAGGGGDSLERWLNYSSNISEGTTPDAVGHWKSLFSYLDYNSARNILSANSKELFLKKQKPAYSYSVASNGTCHSISVRSESSVSALAFNPSTRAITFTVAGSNGTMGNAVITIPTTLVSGNFTASVDGQNVESQSTSTSTSTTISLEYAGGIRSITLMAPATP